MDGIRKELAPTTVYAYRSLLPSLFQSVLGEDNFRKTVFDRLVPNGSVYVSRHKLIPTLEQTVSMLKLAHPQYRAIIGILACSGMRIGEVLTRKMADLEIRPTGYARVKLQAFETKARYLRYTFLTKEVVEWVKIQQVHYPSEYVFAGETKGHLQYQGVLHQIKQLYRKIGLTDAADKSEIWTIHSFRTFAGDYMRKCGLPEKFVLATIGHKNKLAAEVSYLDWKEIEESWVENCADKMCFLDHSAVAQKQVADLTRQNGKLETLLERLLERLPSKSSTNRRT